MSGISLADINYAKLIDKIRTGYKTLERFGYGFSNLIPIYYAAS